MEQRNRNIRILVQDDQDIFREGIVNILRQENTFEIVGVLDKNGLIEAVQNKQPEVVVVSAQSKQTDIEGAIRHISKKYPQISILTLSNFDDLQSIVTMLRAGAKGCLIRSAAKKELLEAIRLLNASGWYYSKELIARLANVIAKNEFSKFQIKATSMLTDKEKSFIQLTCRGYTIKEISSIAKVSIKTIQHRKENIYEKLGTQSITELMNYAIINSLYNPFDFY